MLNETDVAYARQCLEKTQLFANVNRDELLTLPELKQKINEENRFKDPEERARIVDQAIAVLHGNYVFTNAHETEFRFDPVSTLLDLRRELIKPLEEGGTSNWDYFRKVTRLFSLCGDQHSVMELPDVIANYIGFLPFLIESYFHRDRGEERYFISHVLANTPSGWIEPGDEVIKLNGDPIDEIVRNDEIPQFSVFSATPRFDRRKLDQLTIIPLAFSLMDDAQATSLEIELRRKGHKDPITHEHVYLFGKLALHKSRSKSKSNDVTEIDYLKSARSLLFATDSNSAKYKGEDRRLTRTDVKTSMKSNLRVESLSVNGSKNVCYARMYSLETSSRDEFVKELISMYHESAEEYAGLIIDIRASQGGSIRLAEKLLAHVLGATIEPVTAQLRNTWLNEQFCRERAKKDPSYQIWADSIRTRVAEGLMYSAALPFSRSEDLTPPDGTPRIHALLIVDQNTASAAEVFAAGFIDNEVGEVIGTHSATAGACAHGIRFNKLLMEQVNGVAYPYDKESSIGRIKLSMCRLLRSGPNAGEVIEAKGVKPDAVVRLTEEDVLYRNKELLTTAVTRLLCTKPKVPVETPRGIPAAT